MANNCNYCSTYRKLDRVIKIWQSISGILVIIIIVLILRECSGYEGDINAAEMNWPVNVSSPQPKILSQDRTIEKVIYIDRPIEKIIYVDNPVEVIVHETEVETITKIEYINEDDLIKYPVWYGDIGAGAIYPLGGGIDGRLGLKMTKNFGLDIGGNASTEGFLLNAGPTIFSGPFRLGVEVGSSYLLKTKTLAPEGSARLQLGFNDYLALEGNTTFAIYFYRPTGEKMIRHFNSGVYLKAKF